ncbi:hypothetical protein POX_f07882 [Penicillium oxalicum]|uniref:hypothetical protein n=1 Tax=Penicillium oxalicum TaxID=69781 RepID=UPI0020B8EF87|nr:hypothetical protein POX_f07882 [Penicillium oxalicum]KAI2787514.1 hypothetical protein POX_f07882 [Penicillium oxalicum]
MSEIAPGTTTILALDFGTTYSGVAWAQISAPESPCLINQWPVDNSESLGGTTSEKVPTELAFSYERPSRRILWGFQIPDEMPRLHWFKLRLDPDQKEHIIPSLAKFHKDWKQMSLPHHATIESVPTDYLRSLLNHVHSVLKIQLGPAFDTMVFAHVITVPAMWTGKAQARLSDTLDYAMKRFDAYAKRQFTGDTTDIFSFPVHGIADDVELKVHRGMLRVSGEEMRAIFLPVLDEVVRLTNQQIKLSKSSMKAALVVGGFGQNQFIRNHIQENIPSDVRVLAPPDGWTAVVRGALAKVLSQASPSIPRIVISSRVARMHYGHVMSVPYDIQKHDTNRAYWDYYEGRRYISVMNWFIHQGDSISETAPIITYWERKSLVSQGRPKVLTTVFYEIHTSNGREPPLYLNRRVRQHATMKAELDDDLQRRIPIKTGQDGEKYYFIDYAFHAHYFSAHCDVSLWYEGRHQGSAQITYL